MKPEEYKNIIDSIGTEETAGYYLFGEEAYIKAGIIARIKEATVPPDFAEFNYDEFWGKDIGDGKELFDAILALPMMADRRLVILREAEKCRKSVFDGMEKFKIPGECMVVVEATPPRKNVGYHKTFSKVLTPIECSIGNDREMTSWVVGMASKKDIQLGRREAGYLVSRVGVNLQTLDTELDKLALMADGDRITEEIIDGMTAHSRSANIFAFSDSFSSRNFAATLNYAERLFEFGESAPMMIAFLKKEMFTLLQLKSDPDGFKKVRIPPWKKKDYVNWIRQWKRDDLREIIKFTAEADIAIKTGRLTENQAITQIIAHAETLKYGD
ncbi:MAG: DNA polymerase III subunit delta [bacterium]